MTWTNPKDGIRIAGTLLAYFRTKRNSTQGHLAKRIGVAKRDLSDFERGTRSSNIIEHNLGVISDTLFLSGKQILDLHSANEADKFLTLIRRPGRRLRERKARAFQSLMILHVSETRQWLRVVFNKGRLCDQITEAEPSRKLARILHQNLVEPYVLSDIRVALREACAFAHEHDTPLDQTSQMLLYWARSVAILKPTDVEHSSAVPLIKAAIVKARLSGDRVVQRHLAHALCELGIASAMCDYLAVTETDEDDAKSNVDYIVRRSADAGDGIQALECTLKFMAADKLVGSMPLCALDLRTTAQLLAACSSPKFSGTSTALLDLKRTFSLVQTIKPFLDRRAMFTHACVNESGKRCQDLASKYARQISDQIIAFSNTLPLAASALQKQLEIPQGRSLR